MAIASHKNYKEEQARFFDKWAQGHFQSAKEKQGFWYYTYNSFIEKQIRVLSSLSSHKTVLDLGCGIGENLSMIDNAQTIIGIDISRESIVEAHKKFSGKKSVELVVADGEHLPFCANVFGGIISINVLHHTSNFKQVLREIQRTIKNKGHILVIDLSSDNFVINLARNSWGIFTHMFPRSHNSIDLNIGSAIPKKTSFSKKELEKDFAELNFETIESHYEHLFLFLFGYLSDIFPVVRKLLTRRLLSSMYQIEINLLKSPMQRFAHVIIAILYARK